MWHPPTQQKLLDEAISKFQGEFSLRNFPGDRFCVSPSLSYVSGGTVYLYLLRTDSDGNQPQFAKGTVQELEAQIVRL